MPQRTRRVRQRPLKERILDAINIWDLELWLSEEIETSNVDWSKIGASIGLACNVCFLLARANTGRSSNAEDDVFGDGSGRGFLSYLIQLIIWMAASASALNAVWVFWRTRRYRLFEANIEQGPGTPSAQRVRVQSSPASSSPMRLLSAMWATETAESRAHPDNTRDVWELAVWDPLPICLQLLIFFSPLHALVYMFELPLDSLDPRPSVTTLKCIVLQIGLSTLLYLLQSKNDRRQKDAAIIQKEVLHEYDTKYVHPRLYPVVRDVATQVSMDRNDGAPGSVESGTPTTLVRRGFHTNPNPNYLKHIDPDSNGSTPASSSISSRLFTPTNRPRYSDSFAAIGTPRSRLSTGVAAQAVAPAPVSSSAQTSSTNFGGSLGVFTHSNSPLKKATSLSNIGGDGAFLSPRNSRELAAIEQRDLTERMQRRASPLKDDRRYTASRMGLSPEPDLPPAPAINPFTRNRGNAHKYERYPSRW